MSPCSSILIRDVASSYYTYTITVLDIKQENNASYTIPIPQAWRTGYFHLNKVFSVQGWLVFQKIYYKENWNYDLLLFCNPVSGERFELPHLPLFQGRDFSREISVKLVFSSSAPNSSDFLVVVRAIALKAQWMEQYTLAVYKVTDKKWTLIPTDQSRRLDEFIILDSKLYAMSMLLYHSGCVSVFNLTDSNNITFEKLEPKQIPPIQLRVTETCVLARDGDEILLVVHCMRYEYFNGKGKVREVKEFRVFKLDMCGHKWIEIDDLDDRVLLMDYVGIQVISARDINLPEKLGGGNSIIFCTIANHSSVVKQHDLRVFSLKDKGFRKFSLSEVFDDRNLWFTPSLW